MYRGPQGGNDLRLKTLGLEPFTIKIWLIQQLIAYYCQHAENYWAPHLNAFFQKLIQSVSSSHIELFQLEDH